ncbi:MAG TPA: DUF488 domain-containing protein [Candidatus Acidoferrales bacterium]
MRGRVRRPRGGSPTQSRSGSSLTTRRPKPPAIFTIGHSTHPWIEFRDLLRAHGIERVVDVRTVPRSRHNPQFNRDTLAAKLRGAKIGYVHLRKLGGLRHARANSTNTGWRNSSFRGYADYMQTPEFEQSLHRLIKLASQKRSAIMCAEAVPWRCHRSLIADALTIRKIPAFHILSAAKPRRHSLTPFAKVRGHSIAYPTPETAAAS